MIRVTLTTGRRFTVNKHSVVFRDARTWNDALCASPQERRRVVAVVDGIGLLLDYGPRAPRYRPFPRSLNLVERL